MDEFANEKDYQYVRVLTDCNLGRQAQLHSHQNLSDHLRKKMLINSNGEPLSKTFHQLKYHGTPEEADQVWADGQCKLQVYSAFWDTTGHENNGYSYIFPCDSVTVLAEEAGSLSERRFNHERWGTYKNTEVAKLFTEPVKQFFDPRKECTSCLFINNNRAAANIIENPTESTIKARPNHINFP
jgi:hypothetical protein